LSADRAARNALSGAVIAKAGHSETWACPPLNGKIPHMGLEDIAKLVHFRELNFLPRVIFSIGGILLIGSFFVKLFLLGFFGVGLIFAGSALNLVIETFLGFGAYFRNKAGIPWALLWQAILALVLTFTTLCLLYYFYRHGEMPPCLQPLNKS
jgi:hypothetical protein